LLWVGWFPDRIQLGVRFSAPVQNALGAHPASYTKGTGFFPRIKKPGRGADNPPTSSVEVRERVKLYFYPIVSLHGLF
jgi:hypothetical protein